MNMLVSTAIAGTVVPAVAAEPDPIFAAIEAHKAAVTAGEAAHDRQVALEEELADNNRLQYERHSGRDPAGG